MRRSYSKSEETSSRIPYDMPILTKTSHFGKTSRALAYSPISFSRFRFILLLHYKISCGVAAFIFAFSTFTYGNSILPASPSNVETETNGKSLAEDIEARRRDLKEAEIRLDLFESERKKNQSGIDLLKVNREKLTKSLLELTHKLDTAETHIINAEANLDAMKGSEQAIQISLNLRRTLIEETLARLQRFSRHPPAVILANPSDFSKALSTSSLLADLLPKMLSGVEALGADLNELVRLRMSMEIGRDAMMKSRQSYQSDRQSLVDLIKARQSALTIAEKASEAESVKESDIARRAANLRELIKNLEQKDVSLGLPFQKDQNLDEFRPKANPEADNGLLVTPFGISSRLSPAIAFSSAKGLLHLPVSGQEVQRFGTADGYDGIQKGISISARESAVVTSPCDGKIVFSGSYRTYGELLIISAGEGYYVILAGMDRIEVKVGQYVLSGEPVAFMGDRTSKPKLTVPASSGQPLLYVEFRKDGAAIDPGPWWVKPEIQKVRG